MSDIMNNFNDRLTDNPSLKGREDRFIVIDAKMDLIIASWRSSLFAHEWLRPDGTIKSPADMSEALRQKRQAIEAHIKSSDTLARPVLGIGITDGVEIGSGRDLLLTLAAMGIKIIPVHIPKSHQADFRIFIS